MPEHNVRSAQASRRAGPLVGQIVKERTRRWQRATEDACDVGHRGVLENARGHTVLCWLPAYLLPNRIPPRFRWLLVLTAVVAATQSRWHLLWKSGPSDGGDLKDELVEFGRTLAVPASSNRAIAGWTSHGHGACLSPSEYEQAYSIGAEKSRGVSGHWGKLAGGDELVVSG